MSKKIGSCEFSIGQYLLFMGLSRFVRLIFWILMWLESEDFVYLILADLIHSILLVDFVWIFIKTKKGESILLI